MKKKNEPSKKSNSKTVHAVATVEVPIAPARFKSKHKTLEEWLFAICDGDKPEKPVEEFVISFGAGRLVTKRSSSEYIIFSLYGINNYRNDTHSYDTRIEFSPPNMHFKTTNKEYEGLDKQQLKDKISLQLKEVLFIDRIKNSFLAEANFIAFSFNGEKVTKIEKSLGSRLENT
jgi:hypothetical protein